MSDTTIIRALLIANPELRAMVPPERIFFGEIAQGAALPALAVSTISSIERKRVADRGAAVLMTARTQVTVAAKSYLDQKALITLVGRAIRGGPRQVAGVDVKDVQRDIVGPDLKNEAATIFMQTRDFKVVYNAPLL